MVIGMVGQRLGPLPPHLCQLQNQPEVTAQVVAVPPQCGVLVSEVLLQLLPHHGLAWGGGGQILDGVDPYPPPVTPCSIPPVLRNPHADADLVSCRVGDIISLPVVALTPNPPSPACSGQCSVASGRCASRLNSWRREDGMGGGRNR